MAQEEIGVFPGVDVIGYYGDVVVISQSEAQLAQQCGFAGAYRAPYSYSQAMFHGGVLLSVSFGRQHFELRGGLQAEIPFRDTP